LFSLCLLCILVSSIDYCGIKINICKWGLDLSISVIEIGIFGKNLVWRWLCWNYSLNSSILWYNSPHLHIIRSYPCF
jgi:hypothetical protein